jgi:hypothetical protein
LTGADGKPCANELSDRGAKWNESVKDIKRGFRLVYATAADTGKHMQDEYGNDKTG